MTDPASWDMAYPKYRWNQIWEEYDPEKVELYQKWTNTMITHKELPPKVREFVFVAVDAIVAWPSPYFDGHINEAFEQGATVQELVEVIEVAGYLMGVHALNHGLTVLDKVVAERREAGRIAPRDAAEAAKLGY